jgi:hypothetical protein
VDLIKTREGLFINENTPRARRDVSKPHDFALVFPFNTFLNTVIRTVYLPKLVNTVIIMTTFCEQRHNWCTVITAIARDVQRVEHRRN